MELNIEPYVGSEFVKPTILAFETEPNWAKYDADNDFTIKLRQKWSYEKQVGGSMVQDSLSLGNNKLKTPFRVLVHSTSLYGFYSIKNMRLVDSDDWFYDIELASTNDDPEINKSLQTLHDASEKDPMSESCCFNDGDGKQHFENINGFARII